MSTPTMRFYCANPTCPAARRGRPRVVLVGYLAPGSRVEVPGCRGCGSTTVVQIDADGRTSQELRPAA